MEDKEKKNNKPFLLYVALGILIFIGVQQYNQTINAPAVSTFSEFQELINNGEVVEATIKEQSNTVQFKTIKGADHFFVNHSNELIKTVNNYIIENFKKN